MEYPPKNTYALPHLAAAPIFPLGNDITEPNLATSLYFEGIFLVVD